MYTKNTTNSSKTIHISSPEKIVLCLYNNRFVQALRNHIPTPLQWTLYYISHELWQGLVEKEDMQNKSFSRYGSKIVLYNSGPHFTGYDWGFFIGINLNHHHLCGKQSSQQSHYWHIHQRPDQYTITALYTALIRAWTYTYIGLQTGNICLIRKIIVGQTQEAFWICNEKTRKHKTRRLNMKLLI